jgi:Ca2+-binding EF-hand superfamily protein
MRKIFLLTMMISTFSAATILLANPENKKDHAMEKYHHDFTALDTNKDGKISMDEWDAKKDAKTSMNDWDAEFKSIDANKDENLSAAEMKNHDQSMHDKMSEHQHK